MFRGCHRVVLEEHPNGSRRPDTGFDQTKRALARPRRFQNNAAAERLKVASEGLIPPFSPSLQIVSSVSSSQLLDRKRTVMRARPPMATGPTGTKPPKVAPQTRPLFE